MEDKVKALYELSMVYRELAEMLPMDFPGARLLPRLNDDLIKLSIELLTLIDQPVTD